MKESGQKIYFLAVAAVFSIAAAGVIAVQDTFVAGLNKQLLFAVLLAAAVAWIEAPSMADKF